MCRHLFGINSGYKSYSDICSPSEHIDWVSYQSERSKLAVAGAETRNCHSDNNCIGGFGTSRDDIANLDNQISLSRDTLKRSLTKARILPINMKFRRPNRSELAPQVIKAIQTASTKLVTYQTEAVASPSSVAIAPPPAVTVGMGQNAVPNCKESIWNRVRQ